MKRFLIGIFILICSSVAGQEKPETFATIIQQAQQFHRIKDYSKTIPLYLKCLDYPEAKEWRWIIHYNLSCCYSLINNAEKSLNHLKLSIESGNTDYHMINNDPDLLTLKRKFPGKFNSLIQKVKTEELNIVNTKSPIAIVEYNNYDRPTDISRYVWDNFYHPMMDSLRRKYQLEDIIKTGQNEFDKMKIMLNWVATRWKHIGNNTCKEQNALAILAAAEKGERFACVDYSTVLTQCLIALGFPARSMGIMQYGAAFGGGKGHRCTEVWSNQYQKWILLDGQNNAWWESNDVPLNAQECRHFVVNEKENAVKFVGQHRDVDYNTIKSSWSAYFYHVWCPWDNTFFETRPAGGDRSFEFIADGILPELFSEGQAMNIPITADHQIAYPLLNQTNIRLNIPRREIQTDTIDVILSHTMPYFAKFLVRINGSDWKESEKRFQWVLEKGENTIEARAANLAGIHGKTSRIVLKNNIK